MIHNASLERVFENDGMPNAEICEFYRAIVAAFKVKFPNSYCNVTTSPFGNSLQVTMCLGANSEEFHHHIVHNDPMHQIIFIRGFGKNWEFNSGLEVESSHCFVTVAPTQPHLFCSHKKVFHKFKGNKAKILEGFTKYFDKMHALCMENKEGMQQYIPVDINTKIF